jgi:hypothetical protein
MLMPHRPDGATRHTEQCSTQADTAVSACLQSAWNGQASQHASAASDRPAHGKRLLGDCSWRPREQRGAEGSDGVYECVSSLLRRTRGVGMSECRVVCLTVPLTKLVETFPTVRIWRARCLLIPPLTTTTHLTALYHPALIRFPAPTLSLQHSLSSRRLIPPPRYLTTGSSGFISSLLSLHCCSCIHSCGSPASRLARGFRPPLGAAWSLQLPPR